MSLPDSAFRTRRSLINLDFAEPEVVKKFFENYNQEVKNENFSLSPESVDTVVRCIGGKTEDIDQLITGLLRGDSYVGVYLFTLFN
jgi:hypothetical protein